MGTTKLHGIDNHIKFNTTVDVCEWQEKNGTWRITTSSNEVYEANVVVHAAGMLHQPKIPEFPNSSNFKGAMVHSARWDTDLDLSNKNVSVIGTGCSAVQIVPAIIDKVKTLNLFQRSPSWVSPIELGVGGLGLKTNLRKSQYFQRHFDVTERVFTQIWR